MAMTVMVAMDMATVDTTAVAITAVDTTAVAITGRTRPRR